MKTIKITTNANCQGQYEEAILAAGNVSTVIGFKRLVRKAMIEFSHYRLYSPNYPIYIVMDGYRSSDDLIISLAINDDAESMDLINSELADFLKI